MVNANLYNRGYRYAIIGVPYPRRCKGEAEFYVKQIKYGLDRLALEFFGHFDYRIEEIFPTEEAEAYAIMATFAEYEPTEEDLAYMLAEDEAIRNNYRVRA